jgi:tetratricopeptide (TPR) repeat protein
MSAANDRSQREVVPRWRTLDATAIAGELSPVAPGDSAMPPGGLEELGEKELEWTVNGGVIYAAEFVGSAVVLGLPERAHEAARQLLDEGGTDRALMRSLAARSLQPREPEASRLLLLPSSHDADGIRVRRKIRTLRERLRKNPRNPVAWLELALNYTTLGQNARAAHAMRIAMATAPNNRFVLRSAAAFFVHMDDADRAHNVLTASPRTRLDPWLAAAEIATANLAGRTSKGLRDAKRVLERAGIAPFHLSELASALGSTELRSGSNKRARQLFRLALRQPTENSIAQVEWSAKSAAFDLDERVFVGAPRAYEARARHLMREGDWDAAVSNARSWQLDQPFAAQAAIAGSFAAAVGLRNFEMGAEIALVGLGANPTNPVLLNNMAYSLLELGRSSDAAPFLDLIRIEDVPGEARVALLATKGLLAYRTGHAAEGRRFYREAIAQARRFNARDALAMASIMFAREELTSRSREAAAIADEALKAAQASTEPSVTEWAEDLNRLRGADGGVR